LRRAANVDLLDCLSGGNAFARNRFLKRVKIYDDNIYRLDAVRFHGRDMRWVSANAEQRAMNLRMQGLNSAVHHLGNARDLRDVAHVDARVAQRLRGPAGADNLTAKAPQLLRNVYHSGPV